MAGGMGMKRWKWIAGIIIVLAVLVFALINLNTVSVNLRFADKVVLEVEPYTYRNAFVTEINQDDVETLKKIFSGRAWKDMPACPTGGVNLTFSSGGKSITLYPAGDDCATVRVVRNGQNYYFQNNDNDKMREILEKYGVVWPFGI